MLVDAGDRWTGNAYVDLAEGRRPVLELMQRLGYDLGTLGNHEFDVGQAVLESAVDGCGFPVICANIRSGEGAQLKPFEPTRILSRGGVTLGFVAVVTNYGPNGHPDGHDAIFEGLEFADAVQTAASPDFCSGMIEKPHYQVRAAGLGFIPGLSVLDLIFNLGPEAPLYLAEMASRCVRSQTVCGAR